MQLQSHGLIRTSKIICYVKNFCLQWSLTTVAKLQTAWACHSELWNCPTEHWPNGTQNCEDKSPINLDLVSSHWIWILYYKYFCLKGPWYYALKHKCILQHVVSSLFDNCNLHFCLPCAHILLVHPFLNLFLILGQLTMVWATRPNITQEWNVFKMAIYLLWKKKGMWSFVSYK